jgi:hypothetical protein
MTLKEVVDELKTLGVNVDIEQIRKCNTSEAQLLEVEKNLWHFYQSILAQRRSREMMTGFCETP